MRSYFLPFISLFFFFTSCQKDGLIHPHAQQQVPQYILGTYEGRFSHQDQDPNQASMTQHLDRQQLSIQATPDGKGIIINGREETVLTANTSTDYGDVFFFTDANCTGTEEYQLSFDQVDQSIEFMHNYKQNCANSIINHQSVFKGIKIGNN